MPSIPLTRYWDLLVTYLTPQRRRVGLLAALLFSSIGLQLLNPQILRSFIDTAMSGGAQRALTIAALAFIGVAVMQQALAVAATFLGENVGWTATNGLRNDLARHCLALDLSFHKDRTPGEMIERLDGDVTALANFFTQFLIKVVGNVLLLLGVLVVLFLEDWRIGLLLAVFVVVLLLTLARLRALAVPLWAAARQASAELFGFVEERLAGVEDIRANDGRVFVMRRLYLFLRAILWTNRKASMVQNAVFISTQMQFVLGNALGLALGAYLFTQGTITLGTVYLITYYFGILTHPLEEIRRQVEDLQKAGASIGRIEELYAIRPSIVDGPGVPIPSGALSVVVERVAFGYEPGSPVLRDVDLRLAAGEILGVLGRTGSGKTTLARLIQRLYDPDAGAIYVGGVQLRDTRMADLRRRIGVVTQDVQLFRGSLRDNLAFFDSSIADDRIEEALETLGLGDWLRSLPAGLSTPLSAGGAGLSAGQAQLLAFARVFLRDPGLVILDEASSRLDPATEALIERAVDRLLQGRTAIIIAHRLRTVERVDEIAILEDGRLCEYGSRIELLADSGSRFSGLLRSGLEEALA